MTHLTTLRYFILCVPTLIRRLGSTYVSLNTCYDFDYAPYIINYFSPNGMSFSEAFKRCCKHYVFDCPSLRPAELGKANL